MSNLKYLYFITVFLVCFTSNSYGTLTYTSSSFERSVYQNYDSPVASFTLKNTNENSSLILSSIKLRTLNPEKLGLYVKTITITSDSLDFSNSTNVNNNSNTYSFNVSQSIDAGAEVEFNIFYDMDFNFSSFTGSLAAAPKAGVTVDVRIESILTNNISFPVNLSNKVIDSELTVCGFTQLFIDDISNSITHPSEDNAKILRFAFKYAGNKTLDSDRIFFNIKGNPFVTSSATNGISDLYLYLSDSTVSSILTADFNDSNITNDFSKKIIEISALNLTSPQSDLTISLDSSLSQILTHDTSSTGTHNYYLTYHLGENTEFTLNKTSFDLNNVVLDYGNNILVTYNFLDLFSPANNNNQGNFQSFSKDIESNIVGISLQDITNPLTQSDAINDSSQLNPRSVNFPVLSFSLTAHNFAVKISTLNLLSTTPITFSTSEGRNIQKVNLYRDTGDGKFSPDGDLKIHETTAGSDFIDSGKTALLTFPSPFEIAKDVTDIFYITVDLGSSITDLGTTNPDGELASQIHFDFGSLLGISSSNILETTYEIKLNGVSNNTPLTHNISTPIIDSALHFDSVASLKPSYTKFYAGQTVPMLKFSIDSDIETNAASFVIKNASASFSSVHTGVYKVSLFKESSNTTPSFNPQTDPLITSSSTFNRNNNTVTFTDVPLITGLNTFYITYDLGMKISNETVSAQIDSINVPGEIIGGVFPQPYDDVKPTLSSNELTPSLIGIQNITVFDNNQSTQLTDLQSSFNVRITVLPSQALTINLNTITPRFYKGSLAGEDISSEFTIIGPIAPPNQPISNSVVSHFLFEARHSQPLYTGVVNVDTQFHYAHPEDSSTPILVDRYQQSSAGTFSSYFHDHSQSQEVIESTQSTPLNSWDFPTYVKSINLIYNSTNSILVPFKNFDAIASDKSLQIKFDDSIVNFQSIINGNNQTLSPPTDFSFVFDTTGSGPTLTIEPDALKAANGVINISLLDDAGNTLPPLIINFNLSESLIISNALFYPNPYPISTDLKLGFSLTQPATLTFYIFNHLGQLVYQDSERFNSVGYNYANSSFTDSLAETLRPGLYVCRIIGETDASEDKTSVVIKLAVF